MIESVAIGAGEREREFDVVHHSLVKILLDPGFKLFLYPGLPTSKCSSSPSPAAGRLVSKARCSFINQ